MNTLLVWLGGLMGGAGLMLLLDSFVRSSPYGVFIGSILFIFSLVVLFMNMNMEIKESER